MCLDVLCSVHLTDLNIDFSRIQVVERLIHTEAQLPLCLVKSTQQACTFQHAYWHLVEHGTVDCHSTAWKYCPAPNHMTVRANTHSTWRTPTIISDDSNCHRGYNYYGRSAVKRCIKRVLQFSFLMSGVMLCVWISFKFVNDTTIMGCLIWRAQ